MNKIHICTSCKYSKYDVNDLPCATCIVELKVIASNYEYIGKL